MAIEDDNILMAEDLHSLVKKISLSNNTITITPVKGSNSTLQITKNGIEKALGYTINKSVPSNAVFTDTKYSVMTGATSSANGKSGLVPAPASSDRTKFLRGDGTWQKTLLQQFHYTNNNRAVVSKITTGIFRNKTTIYTFPNDYFGSIKATATQDGDAWARIWLGNTHGEYIDDSGGWSHTLIYIPSKTTISVQNEKFSWEYIIELDGIWLL